MSLIKERILQVADYKNITRKEFLKKIGSSYSNFTGNSKKSSPSTDVINEITSQFIDISPEWLLTGEGEMLREPKRLVPTHTFPLKSDRLQEEQLVPLYDFQATAGFSESLDASSSVVPIDTIKIPNLPNCDGAISIVGDSMYPLLTSGDIVVYKEIKDISNDIFNGSVYILTIVLNDDEYYTTVKYIKKSDTPDHIILVSHNSHHQDREIHINKIKALGLVKASIRINSMI